MSRRKKAAEAQSLREQLHGTLSKLKDATESLTPVRQRIREAADTGDFEPITGLHELPVAAAR